MSIPSYHWHFHRRLLERYGIILAPGEFSRMMRDIRSGRADLVERRPRGGIIYGVDIASVRRRIYVLMDGAWVISAWPPQYDLDAKYQQIDEVLRLPQWRWAGSPTDNAIERAGLGSSESPSQAGAGLEAENNMGAQCQKSGSS